MTSEVAILTPLCVSMAADSAVSYRMGNGQFKIFHSANKLFSLSHHHPVGIMTYGLVTINDLPWEVVIKAFQRQHGNESFNTLEKYRQKFIEFVVAFLQEEEFHKEKFFRTMFSSFLNTLAATVEHNMEADRPVRLADCIDSRDQFWTLDKQLPHLKREDIEFYHTQIVPNANSLIEEFMGKHKLPAASKITLQSLANKFGIINIFPQRELTSGIVIAGYGEDEYSPSLIEIKNIEGMYGKHLKYSGIDQKKSPGIVFFGQSDMMETFFEGFSHHDRNEIHKAAEDVLLGITDKVVKLTHPDQKNAVANIFNKENPSLMEDFDKALEQLKTENYNAYFEMLPVMPIEEVATMAETVVSLTSFQRKMSKSAETVGGEVDVAVISKGDGFIWAKRKNYFDLDLNHHFYKNHYNE